MEKHFATLRILDYDSKYKLTRSASNLDLSNSVLSKKFNQTGSCESLVKKYTWEEIFDTKSKTRQIRVSKVVKFDDNERHNLWKEIIPALKINVRKNLEMSTDRDIPEYMEVEDSNTDESLSPPKNPKKSSFFPIQSAPSTSSIADISSNPFQSNLCRSSRSDITNSQKEKIDKFNVSKSFSQFTFEENHSNESKENLYVEKLRTSSQDCILKNNNGIKPELKREKKKLRPLMPEKKKKSTCNCSCWQIIFFFLLPIAIILISTIVSQQKMNVKFCEPSFNFTNVTKNLKELVYGQTQGVTDIIEFLENDVSNFKIIAIVGKTGVGKSHVAKIIQNSLPQSCYIIEYFPPVYNKVSQAHSALSTCRCNLIILENLGLEDISDAAFFSHALLTRAPKLCVLILSLFNTQDTNNNLIRKIDLKESVTNIENIFQKEGVKIKTVGFESLHEESIIKCINQAIIDSNSKLSDDDINQIKKSLQIADSGCKGAYSKVQLFRKISN